MRYALDHIDSGLAKRVDLVRIVGHQAHRFESEERQHAGGDAVKAFVAFEAEPLIGLHGVETLVLQTIGAELVYESDAAAFLCQIEQDTASGTRDGGDGASELRAAITFERSEEIAGEAFRMQAYQYGPIRQRIADEDCEMLWFSIARAEGDDFRALRRIERHALARDERERAHNKRIVVADRGSRNRRRIGG